MGSVARCAILPDSRHIGSLPRSEPVPRVHGLLASASIPSRLPMSGSGDVLRLRQGRLLTEDSESCCVRSLLLCSP